MNGRRTDMKLYTEEQVRDAMRFYSINNCGYHNLLFEDKVFEKLTPIELPGDVEIFNQCKIGSMDIKQQLCFQLGAKWMRDQIQGGNK